MAKIVIAGAADCPQFAKIELLADDLAKNLPNFQLHKIVRTAGDWPEWSRHCCRERGWRQQKSPIIWRELVNQGGRGVLIGGANEFQEFASSFYNFESSVLSPEMLAVAKDNARYKAELDTEESQLRSLSKPLQVVITAAASPQVYQLLPLLMDGSVFGRDTELAFTLFDRNVSDVGELEGLAMEAFDCSHPLVRQIRACVNFAEAAATADVLLLLDEELQTPPPPPPTAAGDSVEAAADSELPTPLRREWLERNALLYRRYADWLLASVGADRLGRLKVLLAGRGPVNFGARVLLEAAGSQQQQPRGGLSAKNVTAASRLLERQVKGALAGHLKVPPSSVADLIVWGDPAGQHVVDLGRTRVHHYDGAVTGPDTYSQPALDTVWDRKWLGQEFPKLVRRRQRGNVLGSSGGGAARSAALSSAQATADTVRDWWLGCHNNEIHSFGVVSEGWYGVSPGLVFSFPVRYSPKGAWSVVEDVDLTDESAKRLREVAEAAQADYQLVFPPPKARAVGDEEEEVAGGEIDISAPAAFHRPADDTAAAAAAAERAPHPEPIANAGNMASIEYLRDRLQSLKLPPLSADALLKLTPRAAEELLAIADPATLRARLQLLEDAPLTTVQEADEATASATLVTSAAAAAAVAAADASGEGDGEGEGEGEGEDDADEEADAE